MKVKKIIIKVMAIVLLVTMGVGITYSFGASGTKNIRLNESRYVYSRDEQEYVPVDAYQVNEHRALQILSTENGQNKGTNFYCLNALVGDAWTGTGSINNEVTYNQYYNLENENEIKGLTNPTYSNIANSSYYKQILWILNNIYIPDNNATEDENLAKKEALLAKAGIKKSAKTWMGYEGTVNGYTYKYTPVDGYNYSRFVKPADMSFGYAYFDADNGDKIDVLLSDELIEVVQQAAIWYYTNYKDNNSSNDTKFNVYLNPNATNLVNWLSYKNDSTNGYQTLANYDEESEIKDVKVGTMLQEQATILCNYLIDAAENNKDNVTTGVPLKINGQTTNLDKTTKSNYYIVGPIKIEEQSETAYTLNNILINDNENSQAYISNQNGENINKTLQQVIGQDFYITIPKNTINGDSVKIDFEGNYNTNSKTLWTHATNNEQPIVEVKPSNEPIKLTITAGIPRSFDLALRKTIIGVKDSKGNSKTIINENINSQLANAERNLHYVAEDIINNSTATYKHRKDPVVVKNGDIITYSITIYNEGEIDGYAKTIVDKLPEGLKLKGTATGTTEGTVRGMTRIPVSDDYDGGSIACEYEYRYNPQTNEITFTNVSKNNLSAYTGSNALSSETIEIECEVVQEPSSTTNTYLTNIAYITEDYNAENKTDRDSHTTNSPSSTQKTTGNEYNGYKGNSNNQSVYDDTNNDYYYKGEEDDDDFEIVVVKPAQFDLKLMKYISKINDKDSGRRITVDTTKLDNGTATTANYNVSKNPLTVKTGDYVEYTFNIYNEGDIDGYASEITEDIPDGLEFVYDSNIIVNSNGTLDFSNTTGLTDEDKAAIEFNMLSSWSISKLDSNNKIAEIKTDILSHEKTETTLDVPADYTPYYTSDSNLIKAYDPSIMKDGPHFRQVSVMLKVVATSNQIGVITNNAAITADQDKDGNSIDDRDSDSDENNKKEENWKKEDSNEYYDNDSHYPKYREDDEDYDNIILEKVDLALTKFIVGVSDDITFSDGEYLTQDKTNNNAGTESNPYTRQTKVNTTPLKQGQNDAEYTLVKDALTIPERAYVLYNIRVYNEGDTDVYAGEVTDYLPNYLDFVQGEDNDRFGWVADGKKVTTTYLAHTSDETANSNKILKAFDKVQDDGKGSKLSYRDLPILCRVNEQAPENTKLINSAEISKYEDKDGNEIPKETGDVDSKPENLDDNNKNKEGKPEGRYNEDDEDYEVVQIKKKKIDLALTKFITAISKDEKIEEGEYLTANKKEGSKENPYTRATKVDTKQLRDDPNCHDATYTMVKDPLSIQAEYYVLYNIRVYNEGDVDGYAGEVTDYLPNYLEFVKDNEINKTIGWKQDENDSKKITTTLLSSKNGTDKILKAFDKASDNGEGSGLDYKDLPILCRVKNNAPDKTKLVNSAEITKYEDKDGEEIDKDTDSEPNNLKEKNKENREQDDDDYEVIEVKKPRIDLALTKFIAAVSNDAEINDGEYLTANKKEGSKANPYTRATKVDTKQLRDDPNCHDATYTMVKDPLTVPAESYVLYNIRVYNEGETDVYAGEITDHLPNYLDFVKCDFNTKYGWEVESDGKTIKTNYLSYGKDKKNLLKAFDKTNDNGEGSGLDYRDLQVVCKVNGKAPSNKNIINVADITKYEDEDGNDIPEDVDSKPNNVNEKDEDDDDYEVILVKTFDLSLLKYVSKVIVTEDGVTKTTETKNTGNNDTDMIPKVEIHRKKVNSTVVKFGYTIKVTNEGDIAGYAKEITDYVPDGLKFYEEDNKGWNKVSEKVITTRLLEDKLLQPGESATVEVIFTWINGSDNLGLKNNIAEISEDYNDEGVPDRDSTPNNKVEGEDDIDNAPVLLSISTGLADHIVQFVTIGTIILIVMAIGIILIKKYVL